MNIREWTLPVYTVLIQLSTGTLLTLWILRAFFKQEIGLEKMDRISRYPIFVVWITILTGMIGSHLHLSWPALSFLSVFNVRTSWISREISFTVVYNLIVLALGGLVWLRAGTEKVTTFLGWLASAFGLTTIYCMARIYMMEIHPAWNTPATLIAFYGTTLLLGVVSLALMIFLDMKFAEVRGGANVQARALILKRSLGWMSLVAVIAAVAILAANVYLISHLRQGDAVALTSLQLLLGLYRPLLIERLVVTLLGIYVLLTTAYALLRQKRPLEKLFTPMYLSCALLMLGEILGRILFYAMDVRVGW